MKLVLGSKEGTSFWFGLYDTWGIRKRVAFGKATERQGPWGTAGFPQGPPEDRLAALAKLSIL